MTFMSCLYLTLLVFFNRSWDNSSGQSMSQSVNLNCAKSLEATFFTIPEIKLNCTLVTFDLHST